MTHNLTALLGSIAEHVIPGGATDIECTGCVWTLPTTWHTGTGTKDRPANADTVDGLMPAITMHIDYTGHTVRSIITTYTPPGHVEQSSVLIGPRPAEAAIPDDHQ